MKGPENHPYEAEACSAFVPDDGDVYRLSFTELAIELSLSPAGTPRAALMENEIRRRVSVDERAAERRSWLACVCLGGVFAVVGFMAGAWVRALPPPEGTWPRQASHEHVEHYAPALPDLRRN